MKNPKRALSLALFSIMLLDMMVVSTGAASYDDVKATDNIEAIEVLEAMGVMEGTGNGFNPDAKVTRQEMAVIMCNVPDLTASSYSRIAGKTITGTSNILKTLYIYVDMTLTSN